MRLLIRLKDDGIWKDSLVVRDPSRRRGFAVCWFGEGGQRVLDGQEKVAFLLR
jgi:hypothetical protein